MKTLKEQLDERTPQQKAELKRKQTAEQERRKRFALEIERVCRVELKRIAEQGIPERVMADWAQTAAERRMGILTEKGKQELRGRVTLWKELLMNIKKLSEKGRTIEGLPEALEPWALKLQDGIKHTNSYLIKFGRKNHDQGIQGLVTMIFRSTEGFNCWRELSRVIRVAYIAAGRACPDEIKADTIHTALLRATKPYRERAKP
jgi:hypothetical protein